ncbi:MAG: hypothetical protein ChlgKO_06550 [Chlamydiales bacterium]
MVKPIGQVGSGKQEEISLGPAPAAEAAQPAAAALQAVAVPTFKNLTELKTKLLKMLDRAIAVHPKRSVIRKALVHEKNNVWPVLISHGVKRNTLATKGVQVVRGMNTRIAQLTTLFDARVAPLHAELSSFLVNSNVVLADDGKTYLLNQDAYVEMSGNPNISTDAMKVVSFLRKQQRVIQGQKPKTDLEKKTLESIKLAIDKVNSLPVNTLGQ